MKSYTVTRKIHFQNARRSKKTIRSGERPPRPVARTQRITKLMALAIHFDELIREGHVTDLSTIANLGQVTRARVTQIMNLLLLAPDIQETLLNLPQTKAGRDQIILGELQPIALQPDWQTQRVMLNEQYGSIHGC